MWHARHFNNKCFDVQNPHRFLQVQLIESVVSDLDLENKLWEREKYWQCQLFTNIHGMNNASDLYASKRKGCRKNNVYLQYLVVRYHYCFMLPSYWELTWCSLHNYYRAFLKYLLWNTMHFFYKLYWLYNCFLFIA